MSAPLLVVDGDSFAHRAFHSTPRSVRRADGRPGNLLTGFTSMLVRLWHAERPRAVVVGWDTLFVPTYRHELLPGYQAGREFDPELLEQLDLAPALLEAGGIVCGKAAGFEADDFLGAAVAHFMFELPPFFASTHVRAGLSQLVSEFVATFGLLATIWGCVRRSPNFVPFAVGAYITAAYFFTSSTSFANPAVTLARAASDTGRTKMSA